MYALKQHSTCHPDAVLVGLHHCQRAEYSQMGLYNVRIMVGNLTPVGPRRSCHRPTCTLKQGELWAVSEHALLHTLCRSETCTCVSSNQHDITDTITWANALHAYFTPLSVVAPAALHVSKA